jgi:4-amino-4-deoxy-L-arabinose transferase-like glycosyltransferase
MTWHCHETIRIVLVVALALAARLAFPGVWQPMRVPDPQQFEFPDSAGYWELGQRLWRGLSRGSPDRRLNLAPGCPLLLAAMFRVVGQDASPTCARALGAGLGAITVGAVYWLARLTFGTRVAGLAAVLVALYPEAIATSVLPLSDGPFCLWMVLQLAAWKSASRAGVWGSVAIAFAAGTLGGIAALTRPSWLLFTPLLIVVWTIVMRFDRRQMRLGVTMLVGLALTMTPWWIYGYRAVGQFVATTLWVGPSLYDGLGPTADGSSDMQFVPRFEAALRAADREQPPGANAPPFEVRLDRLLRDAALRGAADHPTQVLRLSGVKLLRMWNVWPNESQFRSWLVPFVVLASYMPIMLLAAVGAWRFRHQPPDILLLLLSAAYLSLLHAVFIGSLCYRRPAMLTLAILSAAAIVALGDRYLPAPTTEPTTRADS